MLDKNIINSNNSRSSLADIILVIAKHLYPILIITIIAAILTAFYVKKTYVPEYTSTTKMFIPEEGGSGPNFSKIANQFGFASQISSGFDISSSSLYPEIVGSNTFAEIMLDKEFYTEKYGEKLPLIAIFTYGTKPVPNNIDTLRIDATSRISKMVKFRLVKGFFIIEVTTNEPQLSRDFADTLIVELDRLQRKFKTQTLNEKIEYLEQKILIAKVELEDNEEQLKRFREKNRNVERSPALLLTQERLQRDVEIQKGIFLTLKQQLELEKIEEVQKSSFVQILDYPSLPISVSNPRSKSTYIIGGSIGFFLAICLSFMIEFFKNENEIESSKLRSAGFYIIETTKRILTFKWLGIRNK